MKESKNAPSKGRGHAEKPITRHKVENYNLPMKAHYKLKLHIKFKIINDETKLNPCPLIS